MKNDKWGGSSSSSDLTEESTDISVRFSRGLEHLRNAEVTKAKQVFDDIIREDPEYAPAFFGLSCVHIRLNANELARKFLERSLELDPSYGEAHLVMARLLYEEGDFVGGYSHVNKAVEHGVSPASGSAMIDSLLQIKSEDGKEPQKIVSEPEVFDITKRERERAPFDNIVSNIISELKLLPSRLVRSMRSDVYLTGCFAFALIVRLVVFTLIPIDWKPVSYHLWQIGHFTLNIGFSKGRMWDLHGVEYLYPILPSIIQSFLMWLFRTSSIIPFRVFNIILGSITSSLIYLIGKKYFDKKIGLYSSLFVAVFPGIIIWNLLNLYETLAAFFFVSAVYAWDKSEYGSGLLLALAAQSRTEFWIISFGACLAPLFFERTNKTEKTIPRFLGWLTVMLPFMWNFLTHTGNFIYPVYYGMFGGFGFSLSEVSSSSIISYNVIWRIFWIMWLLLSAIGLFRLMKKKPENYPIYVCFLGVTLFHGIQESIFPQSIFGRFFYPGLFPLTSKYFLSGFLLFSPLVFNFLLRERLRKYQLNKMLLLIVVISLIVVLPKISLKAKGIESSDATNIMKYYDGGTIVSDDVYITYLLSNHPWNIPAENIIGSFYNPFYYGIKDIDSMIEWFKNNNITLFLNTGKKGSSQIFSLIQQESPDLLIHKEGIIYQVNNTMLE